MNIPRNSINAHNKAVSFSGHSKELDKTGYEVQKFYYLYDPEKYTCDVELYNLIKDDKGNLNVSSPNSPQAVVPMDGMSVSADMYDYPEIDSGLGFAYRFKLTDKATKETSYAFDNGTVIGILDAKKGNEYNVILNNRAIINKNGPMELIMPDEFYPGIENVDGKPQLNESLRAKALAAVRTHANKLGGNFYGIMARLPQLEKENIKRIVGTPFTKDRISSHKYWTENAYQVSPEFGTIEDFKKLQTELFKHDINWVADAALVNEGFGGIHLSDMIRKGSESFSKNMFRAEERPQFGVLPDVCDNTRMKIINAPFLIGEDGSYNKQNPDFNPAKPTYIQFYDEKLASEEQKKSDSPDRMTTYDNKNTDNVFDITKHDDAVYPFPFEVSPVELERNVKSVLESKGKIDLSDVDTMKLLTDFTTFQIVNKSAAGGLEVWDGNVDIAKLNFYRCDKDDARFSKLPEAERQEAIADFDRGALAVREYAVNSGKYWTRVTADTILDYSSKTFGGKCKTADDYLKAIQKAVKAGELPKSTLKVVDAEVIENVLNDDYNLRTLNDADMRADFNPEGFGNDYKISDYILRKSMDCPFETLPFATNLLGVMSSPYIQKKANTEEELGVSRYDISKAGNPNLPEKYAYVYEQAENVYKEQVVPFISSVLSNVSGISEDGMVSDYGKYVISDVADDLTKYLFTKALNPKADIRISNDGTFDFSHVDESEITIQSLGIPYSGKSAEEEAQIVVDLLRKGINNISDADKSDLTAKITERFKNRTLNDFRVSEMIIDRTEAGLGWRIDASKDIAAIDSVRSDADSMTQAWKNVTDFWKLYNQSALEINKHAYTTAEITDLFGLLQNEAKTVFTSDADAERKFLEETGITSIANYNYFFSLLPDLYANKSFETGSESWMSSQGKNFELRNKLDTGWSGTNPGFLFNSPEDGVTNSYTFIGNHDKPRVLHGLALDMGLYHFSFARSSKEVKELQQLVADLSSKSDLTDDERNKKAKAEKVLNNYKAASICLGKSIDQIDDKVSGPAVAMGSRLRSAFYDVLGDSDTLKDVNKAIADLASGTFKGKTFDAGAFGTRNLETAIRVVLDQVEFNGGKVPNRQKLEAQTLEKILTPAFDRFYSMYKLLMVLPGSPTDFAGDKLGATGGETKAKNYHQQNRNVIPWEWLDDDNYKFAGEFYNNMTKIGQLREKSELSALNDGATVTLPIAIPDKQKDGTVNVKTSETMQAILRYNDKGSAIIALTDLSGANTPFTERMKRGENKTSTEANLFNRIVLCPEQATEKQGLKHGMAPGTKFKNERSGDNSIYKIATMTKDGKEYYYLRREDAQGRELPIKIKPEDLNTLVLYKVD